MDRDRGTELEGMTVSLYIFFIALAYLTLVRMTRMWSNWGALSPRG